MFNNCKSLTFLNLNNFALKDDVLIYDFLDSCNNNLVICLAATKASEIYEKYLAKYTFDCYAICNKGNIYYCSFI
jgi:hypothetical protein